MDILSCVFKERGWHVWCEHVPVKDLKEGIEVFYNYTHFKHNCKL
jgi:hypothetical protein